MAAPPLDTCPSDPADLLTARRLGHAFCGLTIATYGLIVLGALVRANHAGLSCPDWPLCFGQWVPEFNLRIAFEWGHRFVAGLISLVFAGLSVAVLRHPLLRKRLGLSLAVSALLLIVQIILGGLTVLQLLASWTVTSHLMTGNAFGLALVFCTASLYEFASQNREAERPILPALRTLLALCAAMLLVQMVLGGLVSSQYAGLHCDEWPTCRDGVMVPSLEGAMGLHLLHRFNGYGLAFALLGFLGATRIDAGERGTRLSRLALWLFLLCLLQICVGVANVLMKLPVEVTGLHSALAATLCLMMGLAVRDAWRRPALQLGPGFDPDAPIPPPSRQLPQPPAARQDASGDAK